MSTLVARLRDIAMDEDAVDLDASILILDAANQIEWLESVLAHGTERTHQPLVTPVDPTSDCSLTHWCVRT